ncbi:molecular chaperone GrpE [Brevibacillus ginsengisoli]|uniref:molecular chaperone GrpE n=1 Tax=Brevibacillus ginsengisoli TaxID=363854 RepID=UPI003CF9984F
MRYTYRKFQKRAKLAGFVGSGKLWLINQHEEWIHDVYEECDIHHGRIFSLTKAFHPLSTTITGYFQDSETKKWIRVENGLAETSDQHQVDREDSSANRGGWMDSLDELLELEKQKR